jgi:hypothetical protein
MGGIGCSAEVRSDTFSSETEAVQALLILLIKEPAWMPTLRDTLSDVLQLQRIHVVVTNIESLRKTSDGSKHFL